MENKISVKYLKFFIAICFFSALLFTSGKVNVQADDYTVKFLDSLGKTEYKELQMSVTVVTDQEPPVIILPSIPAEPGYKNLGWAVKKKDGSKVLYAFGKKIKIIGNARFYLATEKLPEVVASFRNNTGGTNAAYEKLTKTVPVGSQITLPKGGSLKGYMNVGWTTAKGKTTPLYAIGSKYTMAEDTTFYMVRKRVYTVSFADDDGTAEEEFSSLKQTVKRGENITLPRIPEKKGYAALGWAVKKNAVAATYAIGTVYKPGKDITLYAVYAPGVTLKFMNNDGSKLLDSVSVLSGTVVQMVGHHENGYTMMGWSTKPNQHLGYKYQVGQNVTLKKNLTLYAVMFDKKNEVNYDAYTLPQVDTRHYTKVILVGDSRTTLLKDRLEKEFPASILKGMSFISKRGSGLTWLKSTAYTTLLKEVGKGGTAKKPIAIVFNSGVNDLLNISAYIKFMKSIAPELQAKNCKLFYMSVNPVNNVVLTNRGLNVPELRLRSFNKKIKTYLCSNGGAYTYMDTYTELIENGFGHDNGSGRDDGLHFTAQTYKRIYAYMVKTLNESIGK